MKAVVIIEPGRLEIQERRAPELRPHYARIRVATVSICGTDVHQLEGTVPTELPRIPGHDFSGIVAELGSPTDRVGEGDRVVIKPSHPCETCASCRAGAHELCADKRLIGLNRDGCMVEEVVVPISTVVPMPDDVTLEAGSVLEPFTVALNVVDRVRPSVGEWGVVLGQGPIGLGVTRMLSLAGVRVIASDIREPALELARRYGAEVTLNATQHAVDEAVLDLTGGGADVVVEAAGAKATFMLVPHIVRKEGKVVNVGYQKTMGSYDMFPVLQKTLTIFGIGGNGGRGQYERALELAALERIDPLAMVTHRWRLADAAAAFDVAGGRDENVIKVLLQVN